MDMPFGFAGGNPRNKNTTQSAKLTPQQSRQNSTQQLSRQIQGGLNGGGLEGAMMAFMGLPWMQRSSASDSTPHGIGSGPMSRVSAYDFMGGGYGNMGGGGGNGGGGNPQIEKPPLPPYDPNNPNGNQDYSQLLQLMYPPPIGTGAQWRNTMKYGA